MAEQVFSQGELEANSSTAWQAKARRRSSPAQRIAWRMMAADSGGIMRAHSAAVRLVPWARMPE